MKAKLFILAGLLLLIGLACQTPTMAQDAEPPCSVDDVLNVEYKGLVQRDWLQSVIVTLNANIEGKDTTNFLGTARELRKVLSRLEVDCRGTDFTSEENGANPVIGPISLPSGIWRATFTTEGYGSVKTETIGGTCKDSGLLFNAFEGDATDGSQQIFTSGLGCEVLIEVSNTSKAWELMFELVKASD